MKKNLLENRIKDLLRKTSWKKYVVDEFSFNVEKSDTSHPLLLQLLLQPRADLQTLKDIVALPANDNFMRNLGSLYKSFREIFRELSAEHDTQLMTSEEHIERIFLSLGETTEDIARNYGSTSKSGTHRKAIEICHEILKDFLEWYCVGCRYRFVSYFVIDQVFEMLDYIGLTELQAKKVLYEKACSLIFRIYFPLPLPGEKGVDLFRESISEKLKTKVSKLGEKHVITQLKSYIMRDNDESLFFNTYTLENYKKRITKRGLEPHVNLIYSEGAPFLGIARVVNSLFRLGFSEEAFNPSVLKVVDLKGVVGKVLLKDVDSPGVLYRVKFKNSYKNTSKFDFCYDLVCFTRTDKVTVTFMQETSNVMYLGAGFCSSSYINYLRLIADLELQETLVYQYVDAEVFDGATREQIETYRYLRSDSPSYLHWEYEEYNVLGSPKIGSNELIEYSKVGMEWPREQGDASRPNLYNEYYGAYFVQEPWTELRFVSHNKVESPKRIVKEIVKTFEKSGFINSLNELIHSFPDRETGYPYIIRSFILPTGEWACDVDIKSEDIDEIKKLEVQREQKGWIQQATITNEMTQCHEVEATLSVYASDSGKARYAFCDKDYWDNDQMWGDVRDVNFDTGIRFSECSIVIDIVVETAHKIGGENSLAKNLKTVLEKIEQEYEIRFEFRRHPKYYLSLDDLDNQYNWIENPLE